MKPFKRNKIYWTRFTVDGQRYRQSLGTTDWREARSRQNAAIADAKAGRSSAKVHSFAKLRFADAAERHVEERLAHLAARSIQTERERLKPLCKEFGQMLVSRLTPEMVRCYVTERKKVGVANKTVNLELGVLRGILKRAKRWHSFSDEIKPLPVKHEVGRALTPEEKARLEKLAATNPDWQNARLAMTLALNTTMRGCELKGLQWRDVDFMERTLTIRQSKTDAGRRLIPLNGTAWETILELYHRAKNRENQPEHFVFPACENGMVDATRPQKSWRSAWRSLTRAIHCPECGKLQAPAKVCRSEECGTNIEKVMSTTAGLRFHDLRHHAITELAESQASDSVVMSIAGHVSRDMLEHYSHVRLEAKRRAVEAFSQTTGSTNKGSDTNRGTTSESKADPQLQTQEKIGRGERI